MPVPAALPAVERYAGFRVSEDVVSAVKLASSHTGVDFSYLMRQAAQESGFRADAKAETSSATGLYQFIDRTWLQMVRDHGAKYGLGDLAQKIDSGPGGVPRVNDSRLRQQILDLRYDPKVSAVMAAEFARANKASLESSLGDRVGSTELYLAHFLGAGGASRFLAAMRAEPNRPAAEILPDAAAANRNVFFDRQSGRALSVLDVYKRFAARMTGPALDSAEAAVPTPRMPLPSLAPRPATMPAMLRREDFSPMPTLRTAPSGRVLSPVMMVALATLGEPLPGAAARFERMPPPESGSKPRRLWQTRAL